MKNFQRLALVVVFSCLLLVVTYFHSSDTKDVGNDDSLMQKFKGPLRFAPKNVIMNQIDALSLSGKDGIKRNGVNDKSVYYIVPPMYTSSEVTAFREKYMKMLMDYKFNQTYRAIYHDKGSEQGFCSWFNMMMMAFDYSTFDGIDRLFQLNTESFGYGRWTDHFRTIDELFPDKKTEIRFITDRVPNFKESEELNLAYYTTKSDGVDDQMFARETNKPRIIDLDLRHVTNPFYGKIYLDFNGKIQNHYKRQENLNRRRIIAQAIWELNQENRAELDRIRRHLLSYQGEVAKGFIAVHIRRGDKIRIGEAHAISAEKYAEKIISVLNERKDERVEHILLVSDESAFALDVRIALSSTLRAHKLAVSSFSDYRYPDPVLSKTGWEQKSLGNASKQDRLEHASGMILSLTLMAQSDYLICTFSSNICRTVQLLRTQNPDTVYSLDGGWHVF